MRLRCFEIKIMNVILHFKKIVIAISRCEIIMSLKGPGDHHKI
jgi:hypothetical protein